jgi:UDP-N-acetylmuramoylalanine-D-glutamate ligase
VLLNILVEGSAPEAAALAQLLTNEGHNVDIATRDADFEAGTFDIAYLDVWTPEVAPRVAHLRSAGTRLSCLSDLLLERATIPTIGVTGTAGKSTTSSFIVQLLRATGVPVVASTTARSGNLWATEESLAALEATEGVHVVELTSSHLAFMHHSPHVAVITSFWPDHLELHGSLQAYRFAKEQIVRHQGLDDHVVVDSDPAVATFADVTPAKRWVLGDVDVGSALTGVQRHAARAALAAATAFGVPPAALAAAAERLEPPPFRARRVGSRGSAALIDDSMAATPAKTAATLREYGPGAIVLVAGGMLEAAGIAVHTSTEEEALLDDAFSHAARVARLVVAFGAAGERVAEGVTAHGGRVELVGSLEDAIARALVAGAEAQAILVSPMFPMTPEDRVRVEGLLLGSRAAL